MIHFGVEVIAIGVLAVVALGADYFARRGLQLGVFGRWVITSAVIAFFGFTLGTAFGGLYFFVDVFGWTIRCALIGATVAALAGLVLTPIYDLVDRRTTTETYSDITTILLLLFLSTVAFAGFHHWYQPAVLPV
jgi:hypothetical protein